MAETAGPFTGRLIIHTGDHKTGTTSIQHALTRGDVHLIGGTLDYPLAPLQFDHNMVFHRIRNRRLYRYRPVGSALGFARLAQRIRENAGDVAVISSENLELFSPRVLARLLARHLPESRDTLALVTYLRPHLDRLSSELGERIKLGWVGAAPWETTAAIATMRLSYAPRLARWERVFGPALHVRPSIRGELIGGSPVTDLFATALGPGAVRVDEAPHANQTLGVEDLMRLTVIHRALPDLTRGQHHALGWNLQEAIDDLRPAGSPSTPLVADRRLADRFHRRFSADAKAVDQRWFDGRPLLEQAHTRAMDKAAPKRLSLDPRDWLDADEIRALEARAPGFAEPLMQPKWHAKWHAAQLRRIRGKGPAPSHSPQL